jgi:hypothetical protein
VARQLKEWPCKTLEFETRQNRLTPVLHRPVEIATQSGHREHLSCCDDFRTDSSNLEQAIGGFFFVWSYHCEVN